MNINKYNIKYYLNNNSTNSLDSNINYNNRYGQTSSTFHKKSRNVNKRQSFSGHINEHKGKHSVLLSSSLFAKTQRMHEHKRNNFELFNESRTFIKHKKQNSGNDSSFMFPLITSVNNSSNNNNNNKYKNMHRYSFDIKRKPRISLLSERYFQNTSDSNSSLKIISDNGNVRKSSLNNKLLVLDTEDDDDNNNNMSLFKIGNKNSKRRIISKYRSNTNEANLRTIKSYNEDNNNNNSSECILSTKFDMLTHTSTINNNNNNKNSKFILKKQPFTIINHPNHRKRRQSLQINLLSNNINRISKESNDSNTNKNKLNPNKKRFRRQRESFLQHYAKSLTIGEQYNYFSFFLHQVNNYEEDNISQIEAENFVNNMFDLVKEAEETNKTYDDILECKNIDFNSSLYIKSKAMTIKSFTKKIKKQNDIIDNNINVVKKETIDKSIKHIRSIISRKTISKTIRSTYVCYIENNIYNSILEKASKKEIIKMSLSLFDKLERQFYQHKYNTDNINQKTPLTKELMLMSYNSLLLDKYFDVKQNIEEFIFHQEYIIPKQKSFYVQLTRMYTLNKKAYSKAQKIENYILTSYEKKDNILYVNQFIDKDTTIYLLTDLYKNNTNDNNYLNYYQRDNNRKLTRFSVCGGFGVKNQQLKLSLPHSREAKRNSTIHGKNISHTISPQRSKMIISNKNSKIILKDDIPNTNEYIFIRDSERKYSFSNNDKLIPYKESLLYKLTCINNQSINISYKKEGSTLKEYIKSLNTNKSLITNESLFTKKNELKGNNNNNNNTQDSSPQQEKLPEFKTSIIKPSFIQSNKNSQNLSKLPSSLMKMLSRTIDKKYLNDQIGNNIYKTIMFHIANNNHVIVETIILDNKDRLQMNYQNEQGDTFLIYAIKSKCNNLVKFLLESGCDPNIANHDKNYPLHYALSLHNYEIANTLINYGAKENALNSNGMGPWQCIGVPLD